MSITCRCTTTSSALVGSSAMISFGRRLIAMAMQTRCFMPPLSSCGYMLATSRRSPTLSSNSATRVVERLAGQVDVVVLAGASRNLIA